MTFLRGREGVREREGEGEGERGGEGERVTGDRGRKGGESVKKIIQM